MNTTYVRRKGVRPCPHNPLGLEAGVHNPLGECGCPWSREGLMEKIKTTATETTYSCGHVEVTSDIATLADPMGFLADLRIYVTSSSLCTMCREPEKFKTMLEWTDDSTRA